MHLKYMSTRIEIKEEKFFVFYFCREGMRVEEIPDVKSKLHFLLLHDNGGPHVPLVHCLLISLVQKSLHPPLAVERHLSPC